MPAEREAIEQFARALTADQSRVLEHLVADSVANVTEGGVLVERTYRLDDLVDPENYRITDTIPEGLIMLPSWDVPQGCIVHVMHFDGTLTRSVFEDRNVTV